MQVLCLPPHVLHSDVTWGWDQTTATPACWDTGPAIRSDYLGRTKCLCWWRACSKIWECRNQCGSSGPRSIDHDSLCIDNPCLVWLCAWIGRNEPPVNAFCTIFLVIPVSRPPFSSSVLTWLLPWFIITQSKVLSEEAKFAAQTLNSKQHQCKQHFFYYY